MKEPRPFSDEFEGTLEVEQGFATVPDWLLRARVPDKSKTLYAVIQRFGNTSGRRMPSQAELGRWLHCSVDTVDRATKPLEAIGALRVERSPAVRRGQVGVTRAPNRYFLRTTDPSVSHVIPARGDSRKSAGTPTRTNAGTVAAPMRLHREGLLLPPPTPSKPRSARPEEEVPIEVLHAIDSVDALCNDLRTARRAAGLATGRWTNRLVRRALRKAFDAGFDPSLMAAALRIIALDRATATPGRLAHDGPWWATAEGGNRPPVKPQPIGCRHCDHGLVVDADGTPTGQKCIHCHPAYRNRGATA